MIDFPGDAREATTEKAKMGKTYGRIVLSVGRKRILSASIQKRRLGFQRLVLGAQDNDDALIAAFVQQWRLHQV